MGKIYSSIKNIKKRKKPGSPSFSWLHPLRVRKIMKRIWIQLNKVQAFEEEKACKTHAYLYTYVYTCINICIYAHTYTHKCKHTHLYARVCKIWFHNTCYKVYGYIIISLSSKIYYCRIKSEISPIYSLLHEFLNLSCCIFLPCYDFSSISRT